MLMVHLQESTSEPGRVQCSRRTADQISAVGPDGIKLVRRGDIEIKGKGTMETFWILSDERDVPEVSFRRTPPGNARTQYFFHRSSSSKLVLILQYQH